MSDIGFIGLGIMGRPMARRLIEAGHRLFLHSRSGVGKDLAGTACASPREVAARAEIVITMLPDTPEVEVALFGDNGVADGLAAGKLVIDMSSISPIETKLFARRIGQRGCDYLDAPVSGGEVGARAGTLSIMVGGPDAAFARALPLFEAMGTTITHVGANGDGQTCKVANQIVVALNIEAVAEALLFAVKAGADPARVREALLGGFANSRVLEIHGERMLKRNFQPGFRIALHQKDLDIALKGARALGLALPNTASCQQLFNAASAQGGAGWDHSALVRVLESMAGAELAPPD